MRISAIAIGFFIGFVIPAAIYYLVLLALGTAYGNDSSIALNWFGILWVPIAIGSPAVAGYVSARLGRSQPLLHGFMVGVLGTVAALPLFTPWATGFISAIAFVPGGIFGAWLWRRKRAIESAL